MDIKPVSIVIPNYNGETILARTLPDVIAAAEAYPGSSEIIVVDDASRDDSVQQVEESFPQVKIVRHDANRGFSEAVHSGVKAARYPLVILLNSDVFPDRGFISPLVRWFRREDVFSVSPLICDRQGRPARVSWVLGKILRGEIRKVNWDLDSARRLAAEGRVLKSLYASGGSVAFRKDIFCRLDGFLPVYKPFYGEDRDLGTRAWQQGLQTIFEPRSTVVHDHVGTISRFFTQRHIRITRRRNRFFYLWLHLSTRKLIFCHFPWIFYRLPLRLIKLDFVYAAAFFRALAHLNRILRWRHALQKNSTFRPLEAILAEIEPPATDSDRGKGIQKLVFIGKSKRKTGTTRYMLNALRRRVKKAVFINVPRHKKLYFWTDYKKVILKKILRFQPDLVLIYHKDLPYSILKKINPLCKTAMFYGDTVTPFQETILRPARLVDHLFVTNKTYPARYRQLGVKNPGYLTQGCDRRAHRIIVTHAAKWASEVAFIGRPHSAHRIKLLQTVHQHFNLKVWGGPWDGYGLTCLKERVYPREFAKICYAAKIFLGCDYHFDLECYITVRTWYALGCGGFVLTNYLPGLETFFTRAVHLEWYHSPQECLDLIDYYLKHEDRREKIARTGYEFAHRHRTYDVVIDEMISRIEKGPSVP